MSLIFYKKRLNGQKDAPLQHFTAETEDQTIAIFRGFETGGFKIDLRFVIIDFIKFGREFWLFFDY